MIGILDYGAGNLTSVRLAFGRIGAEARLVTSPEEAIGCDRLVFPGVGSAKSAMDGLVERGFDRLVKEAVGKGLPVLAICVGMQLLLEHDTEDGGVDGLAIIRGRVQRFDFPPEQRVKVPHIGWNAVRFAKPHPVLQGISDGTAFYFVHSYYASPAVPDAIAGITEYAGLEYASALASASVFATQFHPERSGTAGLKLLKNFTEWDGKPCC